MNIATVKLCESIKIPHPKVYLGMVKKTSESAISHIYPCFNLADELFAIMLTPMLRMPKKPPFTYTPPYFYFSVPAPALLQVQFTLKSCSAE